MKPQDESTDHSDENDDFMAGSQPSSVPKKTTTVSWAASEYIEHNHGASWYGLLALATIVLAVGIYFLTKDYFATGTIGVLGVIISVFATHKPQEANYELSSRGLQVGKKMYSYGDFRSFSIIQDGGLTSISLIPLKRFMPPISVYFDPKDEERITNVLGDHLPYEEHRLDNVERLTRRLRL